MDTMKVKDDFRSVRSIIAQYIDGTQSIAQCIDQFNKFNETSTFPNILLDSLCIFDQEISGLNDVAKMEKFHSLCGALFKKYLPEEVGRVHIDSLAEESFQSRVIKQKTRIFFKQVKFNLLREESEGYAKLIVDLCQHLQTNVAKVTPGSALQNIRCLIGQFNLDPNRVLDVMLECFEQSLSEHTFFLELIRQYGCSQQDLCHVIGFKLALYHQPASLMADGELSETPSSAERLNCLLLEERPGAPFYRMVALMIRAQLVEMSVLYTYTVPKFQSITEELHSLVTDTASKQRKLAMSSIAMSESTTTSLARSEISDNQKLSLLLALLDVGHWPSAKQLLDKMPYVYPMAQPTIARATCRLIELLIDPLYVKFCPGYAEIRDSYKSEPKNNDESTEQNFIDPNLLSHDWSNFFDSIVPILLQLGPYIARDNQVFSKIVRICISFMETKTKNPELLAQHNNLVMELCEDCLVPSLSLFSNNCSVCEELWLLLKLFPYNIRYRFYGYWKNVHFERHPELALLKGESTGKVRYVMKRLSRETFKVIGRQLGRLCHSNPIVVFEYILNQIQQFENLISPVVESLKFVTCLGYDVLAYCVIEQLADPNKQKQKIGDGTLSSWLRSLATFVGQAFRRYGVELTGVLQYVANQLKAGNSFDLCVLREIVENMSGIETTQQMTHEQVEALAGGDFLRQESAYYTQVKNTKKSINRLKDALLQEDLVVSLCLLMAQQRYSIVFREGVDMHLKLVGQMLDQCQETLVQFANFLSTNLKSEDYARCMPTPVDLLQKYHLSLDATMLLSRPIYVSKINASYDELKRSDRTNKVSTTSERKIQHYQTAGEQVLSSLSDDFLSIIPQSVWQDMSSKLFTSFWILTAYDIYVPSKMYEREIEKLHKAVVQLEETRDSTELKRKREREQKLIEEQRRQTEHVARVRARMRAEADQWFPASGPKANSIKAFMQYCLLPRILFSDIDAIYCAKFLQLLSAICTTSFNIMILNDKIFNDVRAILALMSENEANHFGRFLCSSIETINFWLKDKETFDKECAATCPIFMTRVRNNVSGEEKNQPVDYLLYRRLVYKWQLTLTKSVVGAIRSSMYVEIRNALLVLMKILPCFPVFETMPAMILKFVESLKDNEKNRRQDLHILASSYWGHLKMKAANAKFDFPFDVSGLGESETEQNGSQPPPKKLATKTSVKTTTTTSTTEKKVSKPTINRTNLKNVQAESLAPKSVESSPKHPANPTAEVAVGNRIPVVISASSTKGARSLKVEGVVTTTTNATSLAENAKATGVTKVSNAANSENPTKSETNKPVSTTNGVLASPKSQPKVLATNKSPKVAAKPKPVDVAKAQSSEMLKISNPTENVAMKNGSAQQQVSTSASALTTEVKKSNESPKTTVKKLISQLDEKQGGKRPPPMKNTAMPAKRLKVSEPVGKISSISAAQNILIPTPISMDCNEAPIVEASSTSKVKRGDKEKEKSKLSRDHSADAAKDKEHRRASRERAASSHRNYRHHSGTPSQSPKSKTVQLN